MHARVLVLFVAIAGCGAPVRTTPIEPPPGDAIALDTTSSDAWARSRMLHGRADPSCARVTIACRSEEGSCGGEVAREGDRFSSEIALQIGANAIAVRCVGADGRERQRESIVWSVPEVLRVALPAPRMPTDRAPWVADAVVYGTAPQLAGPRGLPDVEARLATLAALGIDTIWLSPIHPSPAGDYGYAVLDPFAVREEIGGLPALRALVAAAHARGMRVLLDMVPNHLSAEHPYFVHAQAHGRRSPYWTYFDRDEHGEPTHYFDWEHLPNLDYSNAEVATMMTAAFAYWARELDVDGFRIDAAWGVRQRTPEFFRALAPVLYAIDPELFLLAEASARDDYWREIGFGAAYDWTDEVGHWAWREAFAAEGDEPGTTAPIDVVALRSALAVRPALTPLRFLDNNDTGARFRERHGRGAYGAASAMLLALDGIPALFLGDEEGAVYSPYELEQPLESETDPEAARVLATRIALRRAEPVLRDGALAMVEVAPADAVLAFERRNLDGQALLVVVELAGRATTARVQTELAPNRDLLGGEPFRGRLRGGALEVPLDAFGARVLARR